MAEITAEIEIPRRALFKTAEVCEILKVQPYVLRSWEAEFPEIGLAKTAGGPRVYRRADVEQVARLRHLLLVEGLTLAGARRKLEEDAAPVGADAPGIDELLGQNARERLTAVKRGLRSILDLLAGSTGGMEHRVMALASGSRAQPRKANRAHPSRSKPAPRGRQGSSRKRR
ncbi:MAG: MerR family transcriptional regulator [Vicinamibacterales bacterium]